MFKVSVKLCSELDYVPSLDKVAFPSELSKRLTSFFFTINHIN